MSVTHTDSHDQRVENCETGEEPERRLDAESSRNHTASNRELCSHYPRRT
ncbi:hypothetical protein [Haladaptatus sp. DFWS20]